MNDLRGAKLIASAILAGAGCISLAADRTGGLGALFGALLLIGGLGLLARQWFAGISKRLMPSPSRERELETHQTTDQDSHLRSDSAEFYVKSPHQD